MAYNGKMYIKVVSKAKGKPISKKPVQKLQEAETQDLVAALKASLQQKTKGKTKE